MIRYHGTAIITAALLVARSDWQYMAILVILVLPSTHPTVRVWVDSPPGWVSQAVGCVCPAWVWYCTRTAEAGQKKYCGSTCALPTISEQQHILPRRACCGGGWKP